MSATHFEIINRMNKLNLIHRITIQTEASKNGLYLGQLPILEYVWKNDKCTQRDVAAFLGVSPPSVATSVKRMQKAGLLEKETDPEDQRFSRLSLTEKGKAVSKNCRKCFNEVDAQLFCGFSESESELLYELIGRMISNLSKENYEEKSIFSIMEEAKINGLTIKEDNDRD